MCDFVAALERLRTTDDQGRTRYATLKLFEDRTGKRHPDMDVKPPHPAVEYLYGWWKELDDARPAAQQPITFEAIQAWAATTGRRPSGADVLTLRQMDGAYMRTAAEISRKRAADNQKKAKR